MLRNEKFILLLGCLALFPLPTLACTYVAKLENTAYLEEIVILRAKMRIPEWASLSNRELCTNDEVIVPKTIAQLRVWYYTDEMSPIILKSGDKHTVEALESPLTFWGKLGGEIHHLFEKLLSPASPKSIDSAGSVRGNENKTSKIFMTLAAGQGKDFPFYLFAEDKPIPLFWQGGQPPYTLIVKDKEDNLIVQTDVTESNFLLKLPNTEPEQEYLLTISSDGTEPYQKKLLFTVPPLPIDKQADPFQWMVFLIGKKKKAGPQNWRLEVWRQLLTMPKSEKQQNFMEHLRRDDFLTKMGGTL